MDQLVITFLFDQLVSAADATRLRGAVAASHPSLEILHNHSGDSLLYKAPLVQYKVIDRQAFIVGLEEGASVLEKVAFAKDAFNFGSRSVQILERQVLKRSLPFGIAECPITYRFLTPWMALNETNYQHYVCANPENQKALLSRIIVGNLLSLSKGFGYTVSAQIQTAKMRLQKQSVRLKGTPMFAFTGEFQVNFHIPELWGIGKSTSRGFGTVVKAIH